MMAALARKDENLWKCILEWNKLDKATMNHVKTIKHISANSNLLRAQIISWIVQDEVSLVNVVPKTASFKKGNSCSTDRILTHADNLAKTKGNPPVQTEMPEVAANLTAHTETHAESPSVNIEIPSESQPFDVETPSESFPEETEVPGESQPVNMDIHVPTESLLADTETPAQSQSETPRVESQPVILKRPHKLGLLTWKHLQRA